MGILSVSVKIYFFMYNYYIDFIAIKKEDKMKILFLLISLMASTTGIASMIQENYVTNEKILLCATSSSITSKSYNEITDCYKVRYESFDVPINTIIYSYSQAVYFAI